VNAKGHFIVQWASYMIQHNKDNANDDEGGNKKINLDLQKVNSKWPLK
jgi:hypothetical protein